MYVHVLYEVDAMVYNMYVNLNIKTGVAITCVGITQRVRNKSKIFYG